MYCKQNVTFRSESQYPIVPEILLFSKLHNPQRGFFFEGSWSSKFLIGILSGQANAILLLAKNEIGKKAE